MKNPDPPFLPPGAPGKDQNREQETAIRPDLRSKVIAAGDMMRRIEKRLDAIARTPGHTLLDQEDLELCVLAAETREHLARMIAELEDLLDPEPDPAELPSPAPEA